MLYHHVAERITPSRYAVSPVDFEVQMRSLKLWGYTPIPLSTLVQALTKGAYLPPRPVVITFDDGYLDVYQNALPVMARLGFPGVVFVVVGQLETPGFLQAGHLAEFMAAGWEVGNHSMTHADLTRTRRGQWEREIVASRRILEATIDTAVSFFAYPYARANSPLKEWVAGADYQAAMGVGQFWSHSQDGRYFLSRIEVQGRIDLIQFAGLLPWTDLSQIRSLIGYSLRSFRFD